MTLVRSLAYPDRFVWEIDQNLGSIPAFFYDPVWFGDGSVSANVTLTLNEFTRILSALYNGADLTYPYESNEVVMAFLRAFEDYAPPPSAVGGVMFNLFSDAATRYAGDWGRYYMSTSQAYGHTYWQNTRAEGDAVEWDISAQAGTYTLSVLARRQSASADSMEIVVNGVVVATDQLRSGSNVFNHQVDVTVSLVDGVNTVSLRAGAGSQHGLNVTKVSLRKV